MSAAPLLEVGHLDCVYGSRSALLRHRRRAEPAVDDVSFQVLQGQTVALVGESGSGKTTIARAVAGLIAPSGGEIRFEGAALPASVRRRPRDLQREVQLVFQNPDSSLNPKRRVASVLGRPLELFFGMSGRERRHRTAELLDDVHLDASYLGRFPTQLSGGERQRVAIARALAAEPKLVLCDEVVSALDVSVQDAILDLLRELQERKGISYLFIAHDLAVVRWLAHRVVVLFRGRVMEQGTAEEVFSPPYHPYTEALLECVPEPDPARPLLAGVDREAAGNGAAAPECPFAPLCPRTPGSICETVETPWRHAGDSHALRCHLSLEELSRPREPAGSNG